MATANRPTSSQLGTITSQSGAHLTLDNVSSIPRRSNAVFLSDYVQEQRAHRNYYAEDGRGDIALFSSLPGSNLSKSLPEAMGFLLGTPVLSARTAAVEKSAILNGSASQRELQILNNLETEVNADISPNCKPIKRSKRKLEGKLYTDYDSIKRLEERRKRKRMKKNIMEPLVISDNESNHGHPLNKGVKKLKTDLALMHGFTASNIGNTRITLQSLRKVGVFNKGKASRVLKVGDTLKRDDMHFSESRFLNGNSRLRRSETPSSLSSCKRAPSLDKSVCTVGLAFGGNHLPYDPANSIIWDIEKEDCVEEAVTNDRQGTDVVRHDLVPDGEEQQNGRNSAVEVPAACADMVAEDIRSVELSEVSLHPSQSASQLENLKGQTPNSTKSQLTTFSSPDHGQFFYDGGAIRSTTPIGLSKGIYLARSNPNSPSRRETLPPIPLGFTDVFDDDSVVDAWRTSDCEPAEVVSYYDTATPTQLRTEAGYDLQLYCVQQSNCQDNLENSGASVDCDSPPDWAQMTEWCPRLSEFEGSVMGDETQVWVNEEAIEEYQGPFSDETDDNTSRRNDDLPDSSLTGGYQGTSSLSAGSCQVDSFCQGRFLLYCASPDAQVTSAEAEVARLLRPSHWVPHRF